MAKPPKSFKSVREGEILVPAKTGNRRINAAPPVNLANIGEIRKELARIYRLVFKGKVELEDATRLAFILDKMVKAIKDEVELATLQNSYQDAWSGVSITAPKGAGEKLAAPAQEILTPVKQSEEIEA